MRQILVDWLVDVGEHFDLQPHTVHVAIQLLDRFLASEAAPQPKTHLQLIGTACMKIAD
jgi:hypothetical protein